MTMRRGQVYLIVLLALSLWVFDGGALPPRFMLGALLMGFVALPVWIILWLSHGKSQSRPRYLPSMIMGRSNALKDAQERLAAGGLLHPVFLLWCLAGSLLMIPPFMVVFFYESGALEDIAVFLHANFGIQPAWRGSFLDVALQKAAMICVIGLGVWSAYFYGLLQSGGRLFTALLLALFVVSMWMIYPAHMPHIGTLDLSAYTLILCGLLLTPFAACLRKILSFSVCALCAAVMAGVFVLRIDAGALYLCGWMVMGYMWGLSVKPSGEIASRW